MSNIYARVGQSNYPVVVSDSALVLLLDHLENWQTRDVVVIADSYFASASLHTYPELEILFDSFKTFFVSGGLESKGFDCYLNILSWLATQNLPRDGVIVSVGGGVIGDLVAFSASTYLRGVGLIHVPTTTTAMIDSSIGGKTGLNFDGHVNSVGTYYNPLAVFMDLRFLLTLDKRDYNSGICEAIKMAITSDRDQALLLLDSSCLLVDSLRDLSTLHDLITWSVRTKLHHCCDDQTEKAIRLILNFGHTFGQSLESYYGLCQDLVRHGEAVALGIVCASTASLLLYKTDEALRLQEFTLSILSSYSLPVSITNLSSFCQLPNTDILVNNLINDKKRTSRGNRFVLCPTLGFSEIVYVDDIGLLISCFSKIGALSLN